MASLPPGTPVYIGKLARSLIDAPQVFLAKTDMRSTSTTSSLAAVYHR